MEWERLLMELLSRRFVLDRHRDVNGNTGIGVVAWGVEFPDGACALRWARGGPRSTAIFTTVADVIAIHGHEGATELVWIDGSPLPELPRAQPIACGADEVLDDTAPLTRWRWPLLREKAS